jgi:carbon monoxide dehydrogenase subunit G
VLLDVEQAAQCIPGLSLRSVEGDQMTGKIKIKVGPIGMTYSGTARLVKKDKAAGVMLEASGEETRGAGTASAAIRSVLEGRGGETLLMHRA